jgi:hypothetical protein
MTGKHKIKSLSSSDRQKEWFIRLHQKAYNYKRKEAEKAVNNYVRRSSRQREELRSNLFNHLEIVYRKKREEERPIDLGHDVIPPIKKRRFSKQYSTFNEWLINAKQKGLKRTTINRVSKAYEKDSSITLPQIYGKRPKVDKSKWFSPKHKTYAEWNEEARHKVFEGKMKESYYKRVVRFVSKHVSEEGLKLKHARGKK